MDLIISILMLCAAIIALLIILFILYFYRDPKRVIPKGNVIVSPADGKIIAIIKVRSGKDELKIKKGFAGKIRTLTGDLGKGAFIAISIFMSPLDVHVNRSPIEGEIVSVRHSKGRFYNAARPEALENEKTETIIDSKIGMLKVIQIAGFLARRIETFIKPGEKVIAGQRIGIIKLGSQVTLIMPEDKINLTVTKGQKVRAGSTILGEII
ncbi:MAG: phosphatidylserine decarboxylase [Nanoarchaeota archaeon]|nr:phosphatidylserine decarboxylase [Nanoarchaeota archaeon]